MKLEFDFDDITRDQLIDAMASKLLCGTFKATAEETP